MRKTIAMAAAAASLTLGLAAMAEEKEITLDQLPQNVRAAVDQKVAGGKVTEVSTDGSGDKQTYDVEFTKDGKTSEFTVDGTGKVLKEEAAGSGGGGGGGDLSKAPAAVQATAKTVLGDHKVDGVDKETEDGKPVYEVSYKVNGTDYAVIVGEDGAIVAQEIEVDPSVVPAAVAAAEQKAQPDGQVKEISIVSAKGHLFYAYDVKVGNAMHEVRVGAGGKVLSDKAVAPEGGDEKDAEKGEKKEKTDKD